MTVCSLLLLRLLWIGVTSIPATLADALLILTPINTAITHKTKNEQTNKQKVNNTHTVVVSYFCAFVQAQGTYENTSFYSWTLSFSFSWTRRLRSVASAIETTFSRNGSNGSKEAVLSYSNPKRVRVYRVRVNRDFGFGFELTSDDGRDSWSMICSVCQSGACSGERTFARALA